MRTSTRSLLFAFSTAAIILAHPLLTEPGPQVSEDVPAVVAVPAVGPSSTAGVQAEPHEGDDAALPAAPAAVTGPAPSPGPLSPGSGMGGDLPPEALPSPPYPQCPITEAGAWWTDPADPYTCIPPGSVPFHEPTPPGIDPELLEPIFEEPGTTPDPGNDCRTTGSNQCTVMIMGQDYVVTFADGKPVGVVEVQG
jgi:hypothetical protein